MKEIINFNYEFKKSKGKPFKRNGILYYLSFFIDLIDFFEPKLTIEIINSKGPYEQGILLKSNNLITCNNKSSKSFVLWKKYSPQIIKCKLSGDYLQVTNVWDTGDGTMHYLHSNAAMIVKKESSNSWLFSCKDGFQDNNNECDNLIFRLKIVS